MQSHKTLAFQALTWEGNAERETLVEDVWLWLLSSCEDPNHQPESPQGEAEGDCQDQQGDKHLLNWGQHDTLLAKAEMLGFILLIISGLAYLQPLLPPTP